MFKSWKPHLGVLTLTATMGIGLVSLANPAGAANGGTARPYKTSVTSSGSISLSTGAIHATGTETGAHVGKASIVEVGGAVPVLFDVVTETAANGDTITSSFVGFLPSTTTCPAVSGAFDSGSVAQTFTVTGGTGRFAGASGGYTIQGCYSIVVDAASPTGFTYNQSYTTEGTISY